MVTFEYTSKSTMPTVKDWDIVPEFNVFSTEFGSGKVVRNKKWDSPRYKFKIKYRVPMRESDIDNIKDFYIARGGTFESFQIYCAPLGSTHTVMFTTTSMNFNYFFETLSNTGELTLLEEW